MLTGWLPTSMVYPSTPPGIENRPTSFLTIHLHGVCHAIYMHNFCCYCSRVADRNQSVRSGGLDRSAFFGIIGTFLCAK